MAGKELRATEKTVLKHSRDGILEQNFVDGSAKKVSKKAEEAVLKTARPDDKVEELDKSEIAHLADKFNYLDNAEVQLEDDYNSIDGIINNGSKANLKLQKRNYRKPFPL